MDNKINSEDIKIILATDCGSTTTKAILIQYIDVKKFIFLKSFLVAYNITIIVSPDSFAWIKKVEMLLNKNDKIEVRK